MNHGEKAQLIIAPRKEKVWLALMLAWVAGFTDLFGYLALVNIFTSHMSGNSVATVANAIQGHWKEAVRHAFPIPAFVLGVFITGILNEFAKLKKFRWRLSFGMSFEILLIVLFIFYYWQVKIRGGLQSPSIWHLLIASGFLAMAMGVQNASFHKVWGKTVNTSFITGLLMQFAENSAKVLLGNNAASQTRGPTTLMLVLLDGGIWCAFVLGAACGGLGEHQWGLRSLMAPLCVLVAIVLYDVFCPIHCES